MLPSFPNTRLIISLLLFAWAVCAFGYVNNYVFTPKGCTNHIIDSHLQYAPLHWVDWDYVQQAAKQYNPQRYLHVYYVLDSIFLIIYPVTFILLAAAVPGKRTHAVLRTVVVFAALFDFLENTSFLIYLFNLTLTPLTVFVALCTTIKSVLFITGGLAAIVMFFAPNWFKW